MNLTIIKTKGHYNAYHSGAGGGNFVFPQCWVTGYLQQTVCIIVQTLYIDDEDWKYEQAPKD
jgi:hypothetical protein